MKKKLQLQYIATMCNNLIVSKIPLVWLYVLGEIEMNMSSYLLFIFLKFKRIEFRIRTINTMTYLAYLAQNI